MGKCQTKSWRRLSRQEVSSDGETASTMSMSSVYLYKRRTGLSWERTIMEPDNRWIVRSGLFDSECLAEFTGNAAAISRMIIINRTLQVLPAEPSNPQISTDEPDAENFLHCKRSIDSPDLNPSAHGPALPSEKTGAHGLIGQKNTGGIITITE